MNETYEITFEVKPREVERYHAVLDGVLDAMRGETTFVRAALHVDPDRPNRFQLHETWSDRQDVLAVLLQRDYRREWHAALAQVLATPRNITIWTQLRADP